MNSPHFIMHLTSAGERWDLLAWRYYGNATLYSSIIIANPSVPIEPAFEPGIAIAVPVLANAVASRSDLPPWKRVS